MSAGRTAHALLLSAGLLLAPTVWTAAVAGSDAAAERAADAPAVSPEAQAVLARMAGFMRGLDAFAITSDVTRDEIVARGYKLQNTEHATLVVRRPDRFRAEISGDIRNRTIVYDGKHLALYSPDDAAFARIEAPATLATLVDRLLDAGVELPLLDVLYPGSSGTLTDAVDGGVLVGESSVAGVACDHLAFRQADIDWQLWVEKGARPLPRKFVITTRYAVGDPQYQSVLHWDLSPALDGTTFTFVPPPATHEVPFRDPDVDLDGSP